jgi:uncharacterized membrane protein HdeD (DUF308 family)
MTPRHAHRMATFVLSALMAVVGVALIVQAVAGQTHAVTVRLLLGVLFVAAGVARTYLEIRRGRQE